ncbi:MAG: hypothetical protein HRT67_00220 [Flavobacteriaceae bacterium]|nr:hypothetical protein [Flavobacteriaceae bacterium]
MVLNNIEQLIEKYENGTTTLQEEQQLKDYFSQATVAPHLEAYQYLFKYFLHTQNEQFTKTIPLKPKKTKKMYKWISVAAVAVLMFGIYMTSTSKVSNGMTVEQELAYNQTKAAFNLLASNFNKGTQKKMEALGIMTNSLEEGNEKFAYLREFSNSTNKIFKND